MRAGPARRVVLVVDDELLVRTDIVSRFRLLGWLVLYAASGEDAIALSEHNHIDAIFTDIQLAGQMCGWAVAETVRKASPELPIVYTSRNVADTERQLIGSLFFRKPYDATAVIAACRALIDRIDDRRRAQSEKCTTTHPYFSPVNHPFALDGTTLTKSATVRMLPTFQEL